MSSFTEVDGDMQVETSSMACTVRIRVVGAEQREAATAIRHAIELFKRVDRSCTRFDPASPLMRANASPQDWHSVPPVCYAAIVAAYDAYEKTGGVFDPRVHDDLVRLGYAQSMTVAVPRPRTPGARQGRAPLAPWCPSFRHATHEVRLGDHPIDLGGIAKGLTVAWACNSLQGTGTGQLVDAGGDCQCYGDAPDGGPWRIGIESPAGGSDPVAVLALRDSAVATSSVRVRSWQVDGVVVHHLIDPRTGLPGGSGLSSVTVVAPDAATAEIHSKTLFLTGRSHIAQAAAAGDIAALWVEDNGRLGWSSGIAPMLDWLPT